MRGTVYLVSLLGPSHFGSPIEKRNSKRGLTGNDYIRHRGIFKNRGPPYMLQPSSNSYNPQYRDPKKEPTRFGNPPRPV